MGNAWETEAKELPKAVIAPEKELPTVVVNALKFTVMTPIEASHVSPSMNRAETNAMILRRMVATFFRPYPRRNPNVPPNPIWVATSVAKVPLSNGQRHTSHQPRRAIKDSKRL